MSLYILSCILNHNVGRPDKISYLKTELSFFLFTYLMMHFKITVHVYMKYPLE